MIRLLLFVRLLLGLFQCTLDSDLLQFLNELPILVHLQEDIAASNKLAVHKHLRDGGPVTVILDALSQSLILENIVAVVGYGMHSHDLYYGIGESTSGSLRNSRIWL